MAKTKDELVTMNFMQLKNHCKSLNIKIKLGETKGSMIKMILAADPPNDNNENKESNNDKETQLKEKLVDTNIYSSSPSLAITTTNTDSNGYKNNTISLSEARKIIKRYCPRSGMMGASIYPSFISTFRASELKNISILQFMTALLTANEKLLGVDNIHSISSILLKWADITNNGGWDLAKQHLNGFEAPPECSQDEKLMFSVFNIPDLIPKLRLILRIYGLREDVLNILYFMDTFNESMKQIINNDVYSKIFLSSIILSKFRNEDITLSGQERYKNIVDFLQSVSLQPTPKEMFQSKRWNTLKKKGKLVDEINKPQFIMTNNDFNKIREKAIKFGSAIQPQMARIVHSVDDEKTKREKIKNDIGTKIDTKALQNKLQNALKHKLGAKEEEEEEKKTDTDNDNNNDNNNNDVELSKYTKMLQIGVKFDAVLREMATNGVPQAIIDQFAAEHNKENNTSKRPKLSNALMASINANTSVAPIPASVPAPMPAPPPVPVAAPVPPPAPVPVAAPIPNNNNTVNIGYGISNGMISSSIVPKEHNNAGVNWKKAISKYKVIINKVQRLRVLAHGLDIELNRQKNRNDDDNKDDNDNDDDDDDDDDEKKTDFYDDSFNFYMAQINRIDKALKEWIIKSDENVMIVKQLEIAYHCKYRPMVFKELTKSNYNALREAANGYNDEDIYVPDDVIGVIWMFVKPFDQLIELKFAVDCINQFFNKDKKQIAVKKLPIQSHRGYEPHYIL